MKIDRLPYCAIFLFAFFLPIDINISNIFLVIFLLLLFFQIIFQGKPNFTYRPLLFSTVIIFIPILISILYSSYFSVGLNHLGQSISFLIIPLLLAFTKHQNIKEIYLFTKKGLVSGVLAALVVLLSYTAYKFFFINQEMLFVDILNFNYTRANFTKLFNIHPTYLGIYILFASVIVINKMFHSKKKEYLLVFVLFLYLLGVLFVNSRIIFLLYLLIVLSSIVFILREQYIKKRYFAFSVVICLLLSISIFSFLSIKKSYIYYRFTKELQWEFSGDINSFYTHKKETMSDPRLARWKGTLEVIKEKPIFGYGTGSEKTVLSDMYKSKNMISSYKKKYDAHNQYLSYLVTSGLFGLLFYLFFLIGNTYYALTYRDIEYFSLFFILGSVSFVENCLNRNAGITFFTFMASMFLFMRLFSTENTE